MRLQGRAPPRKTILPPKSVFFFFAFLHTVIKGLQALGEPNRTVAENGYKTLPLCQVYYLKCLINFDKRGLRAAAWESTSGVWKKKKGAHWIRWWQVRNLN